MALLILVICFIAIFINAGILLSPSTGKREVLVCSILIFSLFLLFITELLTCFSLINYTSLCICWGAVTLANIIHLYTKNAAAANFVSACRQRVSSVCHSFKGVEKFWLIATFVVLLLVFAQGIVYPPNNWDSMTYHLSRVVSWISRGSVDHFPTHVFYQVYQGPFAEYAVMHINLLARSDYFAAIVQFSALLGVMITLSVIVKALGLGRRYQVMAIVLTATIPEAILQASTTQTDVAAAFFIITATYFAFKAIQGLNVKYFFFLGLAIGFALLTKATAYLYLAPVLLVFGISILTRLFKTKKLNYLWYSLIAILIIISINSRQYYRNYELSHNVLGTPQSDMDMYNNKKISPAYILSGIIKNAGLQIGILGSTKPTIVANDVIYKLHKGIGVNINDPSNNFTNSTYHIMAGKANHEDYASNFIPLILIIISSVIIVISSLKNKESRLALLLLAIIFLQVCLFCGYLKWQIWNTRLHTPAFLLSVVLICYAAYVSRKFKMVVSVIIPILLLYAFVIVLRDATKPYIGVNANKKASLSEMLEPRYEKYFENRPYLYPEYNAVNNSIQQLHYKNIGLMIGTDDWEYPLFTTCYAQELNPVHLNVRNVSKNIPNVFTVVDCIVSTKINKPFIEFNGKRFYNQDGKNKYLFFYK